VQQVLGSQRHASCPAGQFKRYAHDTFIGTAKHFRADQAIGPGKVEIVRLTFVQQGACQRYGNITLTEPGTDHGDVSATEAGVK